MTRKTALLHIGTPKTGTTSIQKCLAEAERAGSLRPYCYPLYRDDLNHNRLTTLYLPHADLPQVWRAKHPRDDDGFQRARRRYRRFLFRRLRASDGAILSGESLSNYLTPPYAMQLRSDLESLGFKQFHVALYIRDAADFYLSSTQQVLKWSLYPTTVVADPVSFRYRFRRIAENWEQTFPGCLLVRRYPRSPQQDVLADFSSVMQGCLGVGLPQATARLNPTLSAEAMVVIEDYRQAVGPGAESLVIPGLDQLVAFLAQSGQRIPQTRPALKSAVAEQIRSNHQQDAEYIRVRYGVDSGVECSGSVAPLPARSSWRVEDILDSVDHEIVQRLQGEYARVGPPRKRPLPVRAAARAYRAVPYSLRPTRLDGLLRTRFGRGPQA